jgi:pimeloyl-ACP methyl ester carboxylesterase
MAKRSKGRSTRRRLGRVLTATALGGLATAAVVRSRQGSGWATGEDPCGPDGLALPEGTASTVTTDDGAALAVHVAGSDGGPTVVLPHCWTGVKEFWAPVARRLVADGHRVVLYDQRGHGSSTLGRGPMSTDRLGDDLLQVLDAVGGHDLVLCGHSMGGMTVQALAVNHPDVVRDRVRGIVLVATAAQAVPRPLPAFAVNAAIGEAATRRLASRTALSRGAVGKAAYREHVTATHEAFAGTAGAVRAGFLVGMSHMDYRKGLASVGVPTRILVGTHDRLTPVGRAKVMARAIPGAALTVLPGMGHMLPLEAPTEIVEAIESLEPAPARTT